MTTAYFAKYKLTWLIGTVSLVGLAVGLYGRDFYCFGLAAAGLCYASLRILGWAPLRRRPAPYAPAPAIIVQPQPHDPSSPLDTQSLVEQMLSQSRYALLLRPEIVPNLTHDQYQRAMTALQETMAPVPEGQILVGVVDAAEETPGDRRDAAQASKPGRVVRVERYFLDRYPVTNRQFQAFVSAGGYEQMAIWEPDIWPGVLDFVDQTGCPGPRNWREGRYEQGTDEHPVVGISWYEASAFARWVGKRLPTDPEWEKAGSWPVQLSAAKRPQRRYPWGNTMDRKKANLWGSGPGGIVSIREFPAGVSVGGVYQLIGNVWEWTTGTFGTWSYPGGDLVLATPMRSIRGGAFDTYFDNQATCQFQSGEDPVARKHNIGFRCAMSACDLSTRGPSQADDEIESQSDYEPEEAEYATAHEVTTL